MKKLFPMIVLAAVVAAGCSGRTDETSATAESGDPSLTIGSALSSPSAIRILSSKPTLQTGISEPATITAIVTDENNRVIADRDITFSADSGVLQNVQQTTSAAGEATAQLSLAGDYRNRNIEVTATLGDFTSSVLVAATGSRLEWEAPNDVVLGESADLSFTLLAGDGEVIPNQLITLASEVGNTFSQNPIMTDASGVATVAVSTNAGADTITALALDDTVDQSFILGVADSVFSVDTPIRLRVISNESVIETGGNDIARITSLVTDDNNRVLSGKTVDFSSTGGVLQNISSVTNEAGQATAELSLAGDYRNQEITVSATVGEQSGDVVVITNGTTLSIAGANALVRGMDAALEITLRGGNDQPIANEQILITSEFGSDLSVTSTKTDASGKASVVVGSNAGDDTITVSALSGTVVAKHTIDVADDLLTVLSPQNYGALLVDSYWPLQVQWESSGSPVVGEELKFTINAGVVREAGTTAAGSSTAIATTDADGIATVEIKSNSAGPATVAFSDNADSDPFSQFDVEFVAFDVANVTVEATPASVATSNPSTISALVTDDFGNPVKDVAVEFSSPDLKGGTLSPVTATTDHEGKARITFTAGNLPSRTDEIEIVAAASEVPGVNNSIRMTVTERQLNVIIGLSGKLVPSDSFTRYRKTGVVQVTDGAGRPVPDATILVTATPTVYRYGEMVLVDEDFDGDPDGWASASNYIPGVTEFIEGYENRVYTFSCQSEDKNGNRVLETGPDEDANGNGVLDSGEDLNGNSRLDIDEDVNGNGELDPRDPALIDENEVNEPTVIGGQITTDGNGVGFFDLAYPQSNALWFDVVIEARVQALGTEGVATYETTLQILAEDVNEPTISPPNYVSPYGSVDVNNLPVCTRAE